MADILTTQPKQIAPLTEAEVQKLMQDKAKWRKAHDIARHVMFSAAAAGNVQCREGVKEFLLALQ